MAGSLIPNLKEEVEIFIENPLSSHLLISLEDNKESKLMAENRSPLSYCSSEYSLASCSQSRKVTPSLPDYEMATSKTNRNFFLLFARTTGILNHSIHCFVYIILILFHLLRRNCSPFVQIGLLIHM